MPSFELKSDLPIATQLEIDRIEDIATADRTVAEASFLASREPYRVNAVLRYRTSLTATPASTSDLIIEAEGNTVPTGYSGFKKGATFRDLDKSGLNVYINVGTDTSASWVLMGAENYSPSPSPSLSASLSPSLSPSLSASLSPSLSASRSPSVSVSLSQSRSPSVSTSLSPSLSASPSASVSPSISVSLSPSATASPSSSASRSPSRSASVSSSSTLSPSSSPSASVSPSPSPPF